MSSTLLLIKTAPYLFLVLLTFHPGIASASERTVSTTNEEGDGRINLLEMSNEELEAICTSRGFELVRDIDENTGEAISYSHEEYVDAAKECLNLEEEM